MNYKRKSRYRFFLLMRSRTPPISSEFRGGGLNIPNPTPLGTPLAQSILKEDLSLWHASDKGLDAIQGKQMLLAFNNQFYDPRHLWKVTKVKQSHDRPSVAQRDPGGLGSHIS